MGTFFDRGSLPETASCRPEILGQTAATVRAQACQSSPLSKLDGNAGSAALRSQAISTEDAPPLNGRPPPSPAWRVPASRQRRSTQHACQYFDVQRYDV